MKKMPTIYKPKRKQQVRTDEHYLERRKVYESDRWKRLRLIKLSDQPLCELCLKDDKVTPATQVHHVIPISDDSNNSDYDIDNLMSLCAACHQKIHNSKF